MLTHHWQGGASDVHRAEQQRVELMADLFGTQLLEEAGEEVARVVDQNINSAKLRDSGIDRRLRILWTGDVEFDCQQAFVIAHCSRDLRSIAAGGDNGVAGAQGCLGDVDAQAPTSAGDEPNLLLSHGMILIWTTSDRKTQALGLAAQRQTHPRREVQVRVSGHHAAASQRHIA